jgi:hypothetical protein
MNQNPYKSPEPFDNEKPADTRQPLSQWPLSLGMGCYAVAVLLIVYGTVAFYSRFLMPFGDASFAVAILLLGAGRLLRLHKSD